MKGMARAPCRKEYRMSLLEIKNVSKIYGELKALDNVSLHVDQGEWVAIMGPFRLRQIDDDEHYRLHG